jgi:hypothetical protein
MTERKNIPASGRFERPGNGRGVLACSKRRAGPIFAFDQFFTVAPFVGYQTPTNRRPTIGLLGQACRIPDRLVSRRIHWQQCPPSRRH